ncbi:bifunctional DNA primase/polymerase [Streptomyces gobiensis]|uniref:bifunctional DNA primase/polymerase n=1 Tax=Streptomyces gobiensis TaxID=2875706 RepID=UPI0030CDF64B
MMTRRGMQWLSAAADDPADCRAQWAEDPRRPYALPTGRLFDLVVLEQRIGLETFDQIDRRCMPLGPVSVDWGSRRVGFFLPSNSLGRFRGMVKCETQEPPQYRYLSTGSVVVVPGPMPLSGDRYTWLCAPMRRPEANPARIAALAAMFVAASSLVARAERYGQEHARPEHPEPGATRAR